MNWEAVIVEKVRLLDLEQQRQVVSFIESLQQPLPSYQDLARLPISQRHQYLAPLISETAQEFLANPELTEFADLESPEW
ncbi:MAG: hypothetical protein OHK0012_18240 [Synechococcales cyanobacterium]